MYRQAVNVRVGDGADEGHLHGGDGGALGDGAKETDDRVNAGAQLQWLGKCHGSGPILLGGRARHLETPPADRHPEARFVSTTPKSVADDHGAHVNVAILGKKKLEKPFSA